MSSLVNNIATVLTCKAQYVDFRNITASTCIFLTKFKKHAKPDWFSFSKLQQYTLHNIYTKTSEMHA